MSVDITFEVKQTRFHMSRINTLQIVLTIHSQTREIQEWTIFLEGRGHPKLQKQTPY
jgi:hypothetical protein